MPKKGRQHIQRTTSTADLKQIRLNNSAPEDAGTSLNDMADPLFFLQQTLSGNANALPIYPMLSTSQPERPLPELRRFTENEAVSQAQKLTYFNDGVKRVDLVLVYSEPHDDYLISSSPSSVQARQRQFYLEQLRIADLLLEFDHHRDSEENTLVFVKVHAPWTVLCREAETLRIRMPLVLEDSDCEMEEDEENYGNAEKKPKSKNGKDDPSSVGGRQLTCTFDRQRMHLFKIDHPDTFFTWRERTEIVWKIMQEARNDPKQDRRHGIETLLERGLFDAAYPLHEGDYGHIKPWTHSSTADLTTRQRLHLEWASWGAILKQQPLNRIRNYFGEKFAFYFAFMDFYTKMLIFPSLFGMLAFLYGIVSTETTHKPAVDRICDSSEGAPGSYFMCPICQPPKCAPFQMAHEGCGASRWQYRLDNEATLIVSCVTLIWCALFVKFWKRREARLAADWDTYYLKHEVNDGHQPHVSIRAHYEEKAAANKRSNPITMEPESYVPKHVRFIRVAASIAIATFLLCAAGASLTGLIVSRIALYGAFRNLGGSFEEANVEWSRWTIHGLIFVMVALFEWIYDNLAERLTELECPKTNQQFLSSLLWKLFVFEELLDFIPIAYAAWFRGKSAETPIDLNFHSEICEPGGCMGEVVELVAVLLLTRLVIGNITEIGFPFIKTMWHRFRASSKNKEDEERNRMFNWPQWLNDYHLNELKLDGVAEEYMEMMIQFSFVAFFVPALPLIPLVCLLNNILEIRVDGINLLASHRRPVPERVAGLQIWNTFMDIIVKASVVCNAALIAFTSEIVPRFYYKYAEAASNGTFVGFKEYSMSKILVDDWPPLREYLKTHPFESKHHRSRRSAPPDLEHESIFGHNGTFFSHETPGHNSEPEGEAGSGHQLNLTYCYYLDFRESTPPYDVTARWWTILCVRMAAFTIFVVIFYVMLYLCDFAISDVPENVIRQVKRRDYVVQTKAVSKRQRKVDDEEAAAAEIRWQRRMTMANIEEKLKHNLLIR